MALPIILAALAAASGVVGVTKGVKGAKKTKQAKDIVRQANSRHEMNIRKFKNKNIATSKSMDNLGKLELEILHSFKDFANVFEKIKNKPHFQSYSKNDVTLPEYDPEKLEEISIGAGILLGGLSGAALGTAGGFAAAGATKATVMALGTASTGTPIASLSGAAATKATLAALGGGPIAAGGGGVALGTTILGASTLGVGLLVGGVIFSLAGSKMLDDANDVWKQMLEAEAKINKICSYLAELNTMSNNYQNTLRDVNKIYVEHFKQLKNIVLYLGHEDWKCFTEEEKLLTQNTVLLVGLLYNMCKVEFVLKNELADGMNAINKDAIIKSMENAEKVIADNFWNWLS